MLFLRGMRLDFLFFLKNNTQDRIFKSQLNFLVSQINYSRQFFSIFQNLLSKFQNRNTVTLGEILDQFGSLNLKNETKENFIFSGLWDRSRLQRAKWPHKIAAFSKSCNHESPDIAGTRSLYCNRRKTIIDVNTANRRQSARVVF